MSKIKGKLKTTTRTKTRLTREFKLASVSRMDGKVNVAVLGNEPGVRPDLLYDWRRRYLAGGAQSLREMGRPLNGGRVFETASVPPLPASIGTGQRRIE